MPSGAAARAALSAGAISLGVLMGACGSNEPTSVAGDASVPGSEGGNVQDGGSSEIDAGDGNTSSEGGAGACEDGTWDADESSDTRCVAWTTCAPGTYVTSTPSATADRKCAACASGSFSAKSNAESCTTWSTCATGTYVSVAGTSTVDRQCTACAPGTYSTSPNQASCLPMDACPAGTEQTTAATPTSPAVCTACEAGTYCAGGETPKAACASGTWDHDSNPATTCVAWTNCLAGQSVAAAGSATTDRTCSSCASGSFSTTTNAASCTTWKTCQPGEYVSSAGTSIADRQCTTCPVGQTSTGTNAASCIALPAELAAGFYHTCARLTSGAVRCWGENQYGQLGDGTAPVDKSTPVTEPGLTGVAELVGGFHHTCARLASGSVRCWGNNTSGQLGDGTAPANKSTPVAVPGLSGVVELAAGFYHTCARLTNGSVVCWGYNATGQLGDGTAPANKSTPVAVSGLSDVVELAANGYHTCARLASGSVRCWGYNISGQLGDGTAPADKSTPVTVSGLSGVAQLAVGGYHTCARLTDGSIRCWGHNEHGQLGDGTAPANKSTPVAVPGLSGVVELAAGSNHTCARISGGAVRCWGFNQLGQLGDGTTTDKHSPTADPGLSGVVELALGGYHSCARLGNDSVRCWGLNSSGQIGDGMTDNRLSPTLVPW